MKLRNMLAPTALSLTATLPAYAHHEYSSNNGLISTITTSPMIMVALGIAGFVAARLLTRRSSR